PRAVGDGDLVVRPPGARGPSRRLRNLGRTWTRVLVPAPDSPRARRAARRRGLSDRRGMERSDGRRGNRVRLLRPGPCRIRKEELPRGGQDLAPHRVALAGLL